MKNCNFVGTMSLLKHEIAKKKGHRKEHKIFLMPRSQFAP